MIKRELYMSRIRPFIGSELIKVMTGIRRCGKSVMLELIKQEGCIQREPMAKSSFNRESHDVVGLIKVFHGKLICIVIVIMEYQKWREKAHIKAQYS